MKAQALFGLKKNPGSFHLCNCDQASLERGQKQGGLSTSFQFIAHLNLIRLKSFFSYVTKKNFGKSTFSASVLSPLVSEVCCDSNLADVSAGNESSRWSWREAGGGRGGWPPLDWRQIPPSSLTEPQKWLLRVFRTIFSFFCHKTLNHWGLKRSRKCLQLVRSVGLRKT